MHENEPDLSLLVFLMLTAVEISNQDFGSIKLSKSLTLTKTKKN